MTIQTNFMVFCMCHIAYSLGQIPPAWIRKFQWSFIRSVSDIFFRLRCQNCLTIDVHTAVHCPGRPRIQGFVFQGWTNLTFPKLTPWYLDLWLTLFMFNPKSKRFLFFFLDFFLVRFSLWVVSFRVEMWDSPLPQSAYFFFYSLIFFIQNILNFSLLNKKNVMFSLNWSC